MECGGLGDWERVRLCTSIWIDFEGLVLEYLHTPEEIWERQSSVSRKCPC